MNHFYKYHGLGNDYIVIDPNQLDFDLQLSKANIELICHRNFGIGSDGILYGPFIKDNQTSFRIFNPDGSEAEKSGNGIRIFAQYLWDNKYQTATKYDLYTKGGKVSVELIDKSNNLIKVNMGTFSFSSEKIPATGLPREMIAEELKVAEAIFNITCVNIGNPHCVIIQNEISADLAHRYGALIENNELFPNRINVQFVKVLDKENIKIEIWERGAGYTIASGSSSTAATLATFIQNLVGSHVTVHMPGGTVKIDINGNEAFLTGPVTRVAKVELLADFKSLLIPA